MLPKAKQLKNLFALDFGTTKFCLACVRESDVQAGAFVVDTVSVPAEGMRRGMLADLGKAKAALHLLVEQAEKKFGQDIMRVVVGVAGSHLGSRIASAQASLDGEAVSSRDVQRLIEKVEATEMSGGRELLHVVPTGYRVDQRESVANPVGFRGKQLTGDFFLIDADKLYLKDIVDVCNDSGLQVVRLYSEPFASASVTVPDNYKNLGVALADIGGGTTDGILFRGGRPISAFTLNVAGKLMTSDLAIGLSIDAEEAEKVKIRFGIKPREGDTVEVADIRGQSKTIGVEQTNPILVPRIHELCGLMARELFPYRGTLAAGLLLTGGGADVKGIAEYFQQKLSLPVAKARPVLAATSGGVQADLALGKSQHPPKYATVIGLLNLELCRVAEQQSWRKTGWSNRYLGQFINWIKELS